MLDRLMKHVRKGGMGHAAWGAFIVGFLQNKVILKN
jgi:hypothetical protein